MLTKKIPKCSEKDLFYNILFLLCSNYSSMHKWGFALTLNCECGASEQIADHVLTACPIHRAPHGIQGLMVLDDKNQCWLNDITASI